MFKNILTKLISIVRRALLNAALVFIYFFGFGATWLAAALFNRKLIWGSRKNRNSSWRQAEGYAPDLKESLRQS